MYFISGLDDGIENVPVKPAYDSYLGGAAQMTKDWIVLNKFF